MSSSTITGQIRKIALQNLVQNEPERPKTVENPIERLRTMQNGKIRSGTDLQEKS